MLILCYVGLLLILVDDYERFLPARQQILGFYGRSPIRLAFWLAYRCAKKGWLSLFLAGVVSIGVVRQYPVLAYVMPLLIVNLLISPYLYYQKHYANLRYIIYGLPMFLLQWPMLVIGYSSLAVCYLAYCVFYKGPCLATELGLFQKWQKVLVRFRSFFVLLGGVGIMLLPQFRNLPLTQLLVLVLMVLFSFQEVSYSENKQVLDRYRSHYYLATIRLNRPNFSFLSLRQVLSWRYNLLSICLVVVMLGIQSQSQMAYIGLMILILTYSAFQIDFITYHYMLSRSYAYANKVVRLVIQTTMGSLVIYYMGYYSLLGRFRARSLARSKEFEILVCGLTTLVGLALMAWFYYRQKKIFILPSKTDKKT